MSFLSTTWPDGQTGTFLYDGLGRLTNPAYSTDNGWSYDYDARDFVTRRAEASTNSYTYGYDEQGRFAMPLGDCP